MTRKEEISQVANENYSSYPERRLGFIAGANWADKTMLDRACEWLYANAENYTIDGGLAIESLIYSFKKAMEGGSK